MCIMGSKFGVYNILWYALETCNDLRNKESFSEYCEVTIIVGAWSNPMKPKGLYDWFKHGPTEIITS